MRVSDHVVISEIVEGVPVRKEAIMSVEVYVYHCAT